MDCGSSLVRNGCRDAGNHPTFAPDQPKGLAREFKALEARSLPIGFPADLDFSWRDYTRITRAPSQPEFPPWALRTVCATRAIFGSPNLILPLGAWPLPLRKVSRTRRSPTESAEN